MNFSEAIEQNETVTTTANGAKAFTTTKNAVLDLFNQAGSMRGQDISVLLQQAIAEDLELTAKALLWLRDIRGGAGERDLFRKNLVTILSALQDNKVESFISKVPEVGRWDDLLTLVDTKYEAFAFEAIKQGLLNKNQLCAKWMPRQGKIASKLAKYLKLNAKAYRKLLVNLTNVVETKMCSNQWDNIDYKGVPSNAHRIYTDAFLRHSRDNYFKYKESLANGEVKINAGAIYPHQVLDLLHKDETIANAMWDNLPNYIGNVSSIPMIDLSGSMAVQSSAKGFSCMNLAIALGLYVASKNNSAFKNVWLNFSEHPKLFNLKGSTLKEKYDSLDFNNWGGSTNFEAALKHIAEFGKRNDVKPEDMPKYLIVLSDMQFNQASDSKKTLFEMSQEIFKDTGYNAPVVVFWNLNAAYRNQQVQHNTDGAITLSGFSPSMLKAVLSGDFESITPYNTMLEVLKNEKYEF